MLLCVCVFVLLFPQEQFVDPRGVQNNERECNERKRERELLPKGVIGARGYRKLWTNFYKGCRLVPGLHVLWTLGASAFILMEQEKKQKKRMYGKMSLKGVV